MTRVWIFTLLAWLWTPPPSADAKPSLCHLPPKWTVANGTDPMRDSFGSVTLVALVHAGYRFGLQQALSMEGMLKFLRSTGLREFQFVIVNADEPSARLKFAELTARVSFPVYQDERRDDALVWDLLDGGKDDMFVYDRCGLLTYYIPFPLSIIHAQQPILQAALLSTYFDNPCGETCELFLPDQTTASPASTTTETATSSPIPADSRPTLIAANITANDTVMEGLQGLDDDDNGLESMAMTVTPSDLREEQVFQDKRLDSNDTIWPVVVGDDGQGSGSGDADQIVIVADNDTIAEAVVDSAVNNSGHFNNTADRDGDTVNDTRSTPTAAIAADDDSDADDSDEGFMPWKIFDFFSSSKNRTDEVIFDEIYNASQAEANGNGDYRSPVANETLLATTSDTIVTTKSTPITTNTITSAATEVKTVKPKTRYSFFGSAARAKCDTFNQSMCAEWATDKLLRARLCCLTEALGDADGGLNFRCAQFDRQRCNRMLPLIKCCLKDFSQLLENYFQSVARPSQRPAWRSRPTDRGRRR